MIIFNLKQAWLLPFPASFLTQTEGELARTVVIDSRKVAPGSIYVAIKGERFDGHSFIDKSYENGAVARGKRPGSLIRISHIYSLKIRFAL